jgi:hypothetical protein
MQPKLKAVQVFPDGWHVRVDKPEEFPRQRSPFFTKARWRARRCGSLCLKALYAPIFSAGALFGFLTIPFFIFFVFVLTGTKGMMDKALVMTASALAVICTLPVWAVLNLLLAPIRAIAEEQKLGGWHGNRFIYYEPKLLGAAVCSPSDNGKYAEIPVKDIPPGAVIDYKIEIEGPANRINCILFGAYFFAPAIETLKSSHFALSGRVVVKKRQMVQLLSYSQPDTLSAIIRVYAISWEVDPTLAMEYTDQSKGLRFVIRPPEQKDAKESSRATV